MCQNASQSVKCIVDVLLILTLMHHISCTEHNHYLPNLYIWFDSYCMNTGWIRYAIHKTDAWYQAPQLTSWYSQIELETMSNSHLSVTIITAGIVRSCQRVLVTAMISRAGIVRHLVRDLVRDHVWGALVRATPVKVTLVRATLIRANLLAHITYSSIHRMDDRLNLSFNHAGSEGKVDSAKSPCEPNRAGINVWQPGLTDIVRAHLSEPCILESGLSETMSGTMSKLHLSELYLVGQHFSGRDLSAAELSETMSRCIFVARVIREYIRVTLIGPQLLETTSVLHLLL